jgi:hypothetical protein
MKTEQQKSSASSGNPPCMTGDELACFLKQVKSKESEIQRRHAFEEGLAFCVTRHYEQFEQNPYIEAQETALIKIQSSTRIQKLSAPMVLGFSE